MIADAATSLKADILSPEAALWFFENSLDTCLVVEGGIIVNANVAFELLTGWTREEVIGRPHLEIIPPQDAEVVEAVGRALRANGVATAEHRIVSRDESEVWVSVLVRREDSGDMLITMKDITAQRARDTEFQQLAESTALLREAAGQYTFRYDPQTKSYLFNHDVLGAEDASVDDGAVRSSGDVAGEIHPDDVPIMDRAFKHSLRTGEYQVVEYRNLRADRTWGRLRAAWRGVSVRPNGRWELLGITQDITELASARDAAIRGEQAAQAAAEAKSQFLANMSHEIRTPMNGVLGVLHLLKSERLSDSGRALIEEALACGSMLAELLNDVIDFSKIEAGRLELTPAPVDPAAALGGVIDMLRSTAEGKDIELRTQIAPDIGWVSIDAVRLRQMLFNLIGNALKFTLEGSVTARMSARGDGAERRLCVEIEDTGIGISPEVQECLFQRFTQADGSTTRRFGGSGLGLSITRVLADLMDGEVSCSSTPGEGSVFRFEVAAPACAPLVAGADVDEAWLEGLRVLIVEDNPTNRMIATKMLENLGASVETADNGALGLEAARRNAFDLIFMDVQMPVMDGLTATRAIRALPGDLGQTPIIAMTANAMSHQVESYRDAGMNGSVFKPLSPSALVGELMRIMGGNEPAPELAINAA